MNISTALITSHNIALKLEYYNTEKDYHNTEKDYHNTEKDYHNTEKEGCRGYCHLLTGGVKNDCHTDSLWSL